MNKDDTDATILYGSNHQGERNREMPAPSADAILLLLEANPMPEGVSYSSCETNGFRLDASLLPGVAVRVGLLSALLSLQCNTKKATGVMVTACEHKESFNGLQIIDPEEGQSRVSMTKMVNQQPGHNGLVRWFVEEVEKHATGISVVHIGRDTRSHSESLANLVVSAAQAAGALVVNHGEITTPCLHHCVSHSSGVHSPLISQPFLNEESYYDLLASSYATLVEGTDIPQTSLLVDCAGGVGYIALRQLVRALQEKHCIRRIVPSNRPFSCCPLNEKCGSAYVRETKTPPVWYNHPPISKNCCASLNGDATAIAFFSETNGFMLVDDDKVACLFCDFLQAQMVALETALPMQSSPIRLAVIVPTNTNASAMEYLQSFLDDDAILNMNTDSYKSLESDFDVCVYMADSSQTRGSIRFQDTFYDHMIQAEKHVIGPKKNMAFDHLKTVSSLFHCNAVSDGLSSLLLVDAIMRLQKKTIHDWSTM